MSRILRHLFSGLCGLSLILCLATVIFWIRSYSVSEWVSYRSTAGEQSLYTARGHIALQLYITHWSPVHHPGLFIDQNRAGTPHGYLQDVVAGQVDIDFNWQRAGFAWYKTHLRNNSTLTIAVAPFWSLSLITAALPFTWTAARLRARHRRRRLKAENHCQNCGYDLRGTPARNVCPECGKLDRTRTLAEQTA